MARRTMTIRKDAVTSVEVPYFTVLHLTDYSNSAPFARPCLLNETHWLSEASASTFAQEESETCPVPQRFTVYDPDMVYVASYQCGKMLSAFTVEA